MENKCNFNEELYNKCEFNDELYNKLRKLECKIDKLTEIVQKIDINTTNTNYNIDQNLQEIKKGTENMNEHIHFIENVYAKLKSPLDYISDKFSGKSIGYW